MDPWRLAPLVTALAIAGCSKAPSEPRSVIQAAESIAANYRRGPTRPQTGMFGFHAERESLWMSDGSGLICLPSPGEYPATLLRFGHYVGYGPIRPGHSQFYVTEIDGSGGVNAYVFREGVLAGLGPGMDQVAMEFSQDDALWLTASAGEFAAYDLATGNRVHSREFDDLWGGDYEFCQGAFGRLVRRRDTSVDPVRVSWFDAVTNKELDAPALRTLGVEANAWVDGGHLLAETDGKVTDLGKLTTVRPVSGRDDATPYSPWAWERSPDRKTLTVQSIYRDGPSYELHDAALWSQNAFCYGLHALIAPQGSDLYGLRALPEIQVFDLRSGTLALTIKYASDPVGEFVITLSDGTYSGTKALVSRLGLSPLMHDAERVAEVLADVLAMKTAAKG